MEKRTVRVIGEAGARSTGARFWIVFFGALTLAFLAIALLLLALHFILYAQTKALLDWYVAAHGVSGKAGSHLTEVSDTVPSNRGSGGWPTPSNGKSTSQTNWGAPFFRVLCGRMGGENAHPELSLSFDRQLHTRIRRPDPSVPRPLLSF